MFSLKGSEEVNPTKRKCVNTWERHSFPRDDTTPCCTAQRTELLWHCSSRQAWSYFTWENDIWSHRLPSSCSCLVKGIWYFSSFTYVQVKASCHCRGSIPAPKSSVARGGWWQIHLRLAALWPYLCLHWCQSKRRSWSSGNHVYDFDSGQDEGYIFV